jgi:branched-chain amino acid transport system ATP-binding protein
VSVASDKAVSLRVERVGMRFGGLRALDDVSFDVERGTILGLIGPNGSGKTTMMNISGRLQADERPRHLRHATISDVPTHEVCISGSRARFKSSNRLRT